ncbi:RNA polymerase sigma factor [Paenibacillus psychroresistens]|uniref:RNA polymerase sigma factor n=1 Tax=Paenibacillus psychroresistens TaxID=1778678 RepID=UPI001D04B2A7
MYLTRSPWDAEDLFQETLLKTFGMIAKIKQPIISKSFLFRVASNKWIDECRRNKVKLVPYEENASAFGTVTDMDNLESEDGIRRILKQLSPKQAVILLLIDVFEFNGKETAELLGSTESAVNTAIHRARNKLRKTTGATEESEDIPISRIKKNAVNEENEDVLKQFVVAFRKRDFVKLIEMLDEHAVANVIVHNSAEYGKTVITKSSLAGWENIHTQLDIQRVFLWG